MTNALRSTPVTRRRLAQTATRFVLGAALIASAAVVGATVSPGAGRVVQAVGELGAGGEFQGLTPARIFDSRQPSLDVAPLGRKPIGPSSKVFDVQVAGRGGLPGFIDADRDGADDNVLAVVVNITVIAPTQIGFLRAFGKAAPEGNTSVVNFLPNSTVPNTAVLRPGKDGKLTIRLAGPLAGSAHVAIDLTGWFSSSNYPTTGARVIPLPKPGRVYDSMLSRFGAAPLGSRAQVAVPIRGAVRADNTSVIVVPDNANVVGVVANITAVNAFPGSRPTFVSAVPDKLPAGAEPKTSNLNLMPKDVRANMTIMPIGSDGAIRLFNLAGQTRVVVDIVGYLVTGKPASTRAGRIVPLVAPFRAFDTREAAFFNQPLGPANAEDWSFESFVDDVRIGTEPVGAQSGLLGNLTATNLQRQYAWAAAASYLTAFPTPATGSAVPTVSNINLFEGQTVPNMVLLTYGQRASDPKCQAKHCVRFYNLAGYVDYLLDVSAVILAD